MSIKLHSKSYFNSITNCTDILISDSLNNIDYLIDTTYDMDQYGKVAFFKSGDTEIFLTKNTPIYLDATSWTGTTDVNGLYSLNVFMIPKFTVGAINIKVNDVIYYENNDTFYRAIVDNVLPNAPNTNYVALTTAELTYSIFSTAAFTNKQTELVYWRKYGILSCIIEKMLAEILLAIKGNCNDLCTMNKYEFIRRKIEAMQSMVELEDYVGAEKVYINLRDHINSNICC